MFFTDEEDDGQGTTTKRMDKNKNQPQKENHSTHATTRIMRQGQGGEG